RQEKPVTVAIAGGVVTDYCAWVIDASCFGKTHGIVRIDDRVTKTTIAEPDKTGRHSARIDELANDVASFVNLLRQGRISGPGIIKSRDHFNRARVPCLLSKRPHHWEHEQNCQNADKYLFWFHNVCFHLFCPLIDACWGFAGLRIAEISGQIDPEGGPFCLLGP